MSYMQRRLLPIGRCYMIEVQHKNGTYFAESGFLPRGIDLSFSDAVKEARNHDDVMAVWELNPSECSMRDISEDVARAWLNEFEGEYDDVPEFISYHLSESEIAEHFSERDADRVYRRHLSSVEASGRI